MSAIGTTNKDKLLADKKTEMALKRKRRGNKRYPTIEDFRVSAKENGVNNDKIWESIDEATKEKRDNLDKLRKITFWRTVPAGQIKMDVKNVLPGFWKQECGSMTKTRLIELIKTYLNVVESSLESTSLEKYSQIELFIKSDQSEYLNSKKKHQKMKYNAWKNVFETCGTHIADRKRYEHNMVMDNNDDETKLRMICVIFKLFNLLLSRNWD